MSLSLRITQVFVCVRQDQRLKEIGMQAPAVSPSSQSMGSANGTSAGMDLFTSPAPPPSTNRYTERVCVRVYFRESMQYVRTGE